MALVSIDLVENGGVARNFSCGLTLEYRFAER